MSNNETSIKIAVRVRPFNDREREISSALVVQMDGAMTTLLPPPVGSVNHHVGKVVENKSFTFDYSFWTHDGFETDGSGKFHPALGSHYVDQVG